MTILTQTQTLAQTLNEWLPIVIALGGFIGFLYKTYDKIREAIQELKDAINTFSHKIDESQRERTELFMTTTELKKIQHDHELRITRLEYREDDGK